MLILDCTVRNMVEYLIFVGMQFQHLTVQNLFVSNVETADKCI